MEMRMAIGEAGDDSDKSGNDGDDEYEAVDVVGWIMAMWLMMSCGMVTTAMDLSFAMPWAMSLIMLSRCVWGR